MDSPLRHLESSHIDDVISLLMYLQVVGTQYIRFTSIGRLFSSLGRAITGSCIIHRPIIVKAVFCFFRSVLGSERQVKWPCLAQQLASALSMPYFHY